MQTNKEAGFSLIELLIVLSILSIIFTFSYSVYTNKTSEQRFILWYQQFELDLLYLQKQTMITNKRFTLEINTHQNKYEIRSGPLTSALIRRDIPQDWTVSILTLNQPVTFTHSGQIRHPGRIKVATTDSTYFIYFPFGKGRCYYAKLE